MNGLTAHPHDIVRVHPGIHHNGHHLGGMHLTVTAAHNGYLDLSEWTGDTPLTLHADHVDLITRTRP